MRRIAWLVGMLTALASGGYVFVYLYRWEWHRALTAGVLFLAAEVALCTALLARHVAQNARATGTETVDEMERLLFQQLQEQNPPRDYFAWMGPDRTSVFIPVLLGGGVVISVAAWIVEKVAGKSVESTVDSGIAHDLSALALPDTLVPPNARLRLPARPGHHGARSLLLGPKPR